MADTPINLPHFSRVPIGKTVDGKEVFLSHVWYQAFYDAVVKRLGGPSNYTVTSLADLTATDGGFIVGDGSVFNVESGSTARASLDVPSNAQAVLQSLANAKGDLIVATADNTFTILAVGTNDQVLTAASGETPGVKWADASGGSGSTPDWVTDHPDTPPASADANDHEYQDGDTIGGTTLGSPGTAPVISGNRLVLTSNTPGASASVVAVVYTAPSTPYTFTAKIRLRTDPNTFGLGCLMLRSNTSGRFRTVGMFRNSADFSTYQTQTAAYTSLTARSANTNQLAWTQPFIYARITNDGTTATYQVSDDGGANNWYTLLSEALSTHFTGGNLPDQFGVGVDSFSATARVAFIEWLRRTA